jgi:hypothetical protein
MVWTWRDPRGVERIGSFSTTDKAFLSTYSVGQELIVLYLPANPRKSTLYLA